MPPKTAAKQAKNGTKAGRAISSSSSAAKPWKDDANKAKPADAAISLSIHVNMGQIKTAGANESIGTQGCGPCVGLIVVTKQNIKVCAHFDTHIKTTEQEDLWPLAWARTSNILREHFPAPSDVTEVVTCSLMPSEVSTSAILDAIACRYDKVYFHEADGIVVNQEGNVMPLRFSQKIGTRPGIGPNFASVKEQASESSPPSYIS